MFSAPGLRVGLQPPEIILCWTPGFGFEHKKCVCTTPGGSPKISPGEKSPRGPNSENSGAKYSPWERERSSTNGACCVVGPPQIFKYSRGRTTPHRGVLSVIPHLRVVRSASEIPIKACGGRSPPVKKNVSRGQNEFSVRKTSPLWVGRRRLSAAVFHKNFGMWSVRPQNSPRGKLVSVSTSANYMPPADKKCGPQALGAPKTCGECCFSLKIRRSIKNGPFLRKFGAIWPPKRVAPSIYLKKCRLPVSGKDPLFECV